MRYALRSKILLTVCAVALMCQPAIETLPSGLLVHADDEDFEDDVEEDIEDEIEDEIDEEFDEELDDDIEDDIEDEIDDAFEDALDDDVEDTVEDAILDDSEIDLDELPDEDFAEDVADDLDEALEDAVAEDDVEDDFEDNGTDADVDLDDLYDGSVDIRAPRLFDDGEILTSEPTGDDPDAVEDIEDDFEDEYDQDAEDDSDDGDADEADEDEDASDEDENEDEDEDEDEDEGEGEDADEDTASVTEAAFDDIAIEVDENGDAFLSDALLILGTEEDIDVLREAGLNTDDIRDLDNLDLQLARVSTLGSMSRDELVDLISQAASSVQIDVDSLYSFQESNAVSSASPKRQLPSALWHPRTATATAQRARIGMIDSDIATHGTVLSGANIVQQDFVPFSVPRPNLHGTAIATLFVANSEQFTGLAPNADLFAASVFFTKDSGEQSASTASLVDALNWLSGLDLDVINMSLSGPPNTILQRAVERTVELGTPIVAAVGNDGPTAKPRFPAGYDPVIAITAVSDDKKIYRRAIQGQHVDFAAPGVGILCLDASGTIVRMTGTSFAAPFVSARIATIRHTQSGKQIVDDLEKEAEDLGPEGFDTIFGHGLIY